MDHLLRSLGLFSKNPPLGQSLPQNQIERHMALQSLATVDLLYFIMCVNKKFIEIASVEGLFKLHLRDRDHATWFWNRLVTAFGRFFWALTSSWSRLIVWRWPLTYGKFKFGREGNTDSVSITLHHISIRPLLIPPSHIHWIGFSFS